MTALNIHVFVCPGYLCHRFVTQHERERGEEEKEREGERDSEGEREREERESVRKHSVLNLTIQHLWKCQPTNSPLVSFLHFNSFDLSPDQTFGIIGKAELINNVSYAVK